MAISKLNYKFDNKGSIQQGDRVLNKDTFQNITNKIDELIDFANNLYYKANDTVNIAGYYNGIITGGQTQIVFPVFFEKSVSNISSVTLNLGNITIRHADGGYILNEVKASDYISSIASGYLIGNHAVFTINLKNAATQFANNSTVGLVLKDPTYVTFK